MHYPYGDGQVTAYLDHSHVLVSTGFLPGVLAS